MLRSVLALSLLLLSAWSAVAADGPPTAPVRGVTEDFFGARVTDAYRDLEDLKAPATAAWFKAQADHAAARLQSLPGRKRLLDEIARYGDAVAARVADVQINAGHVYYTKRLANENVPKLYVRVGLRGRERLLVDPNRVPPAGGGHHSVSYFSASPDNRFLAYGVSASGSEEAVLHILDLKTGKQVGGGIDRAKFAAPSWLPDGRVLYGRLPKLPDGAPDTERYQNIVVYLHTPGTDPERDVPVLGPKLSPVVGIDPAEQAYVVATPGSAHLVAMAVNGTQRELRLWTARLDQFDGPRTPWKPIAEIADGVTDWSVKGDDLYVVSHRDAPRFKVLRVALTKPSLAEAETVVPTSEAVVTGLAAAADGLYVRRMNGGSSDLLRVSHLPGAKPVGIRLPFSMDIDAMVADPREPGAVFDASAWTRFGGYFAVDTRRGRVVDTGLQPQGRYDNPPDLVATEVKVKSHDGTLVPVSIVHRKGLKLDGRNPTIVYGYGAYGVSMTPFYRPTFLPWFRRGGVFAVAHVRGGGEYGQEWYRAGFQATKPNTWKDGIAAAQWLVEHRYASPRTLSIMGGSAGGIFVGRAITERPDLFGAAVDQVPLSDMLRAEFSANGVANIPEFGTVKDEAGFKALLAMSAVHAVKDGTPYPAVLVTTGFNDSRVPAWQAGKMAARLQAATSSGKPVLLRVDYEAGHGIGSTKQQQYEERADTFAFLLWQAGVPGFQP